MVLPTSRAAFGALSQSSLEKTASWCRQHRLTLAGGCVAVVAAAVLLRPAAPPGRLDLHALRSLSAEKAGEIAGFPGTIDLRGLPTLSAEAARAVAAHAGRLQLDGLAEISDAAAAALVAHTAPLSIDGLVLRARDDEIVTVPLAALLSRHAGPLRFDRLA